MLKTIDAFLNKTTMYRLVLYYLVGLVIAAMVLGLFGLVPYSPVAILFSAAFFVVVSWVANALFSWGFEAPVNVESVYITALILALIVSPLTSLNDTTFFALAMWASLWAMGSKYILAVGRKHLFNPAAFAVALTYLTVGLSASWWVGTVWMAPFVLVGGLLVVRKLRRTDLVVSFFVFALAAVLLPYLTSGGDVMAALGKITLGSPLFFFAFVMLTEPLTTPPKWYARIVYGGFVGILFSPFAHIASFYFTPELALLAGNVFSYLASPKYKFVLKLKDKIRVAHDAYDFVFSKEGSFDFRPGQYMEWTLAHAYADNRGNRRYFTLASAPSEADVRLGLKFYAPASTYKRALAEMQVGDTIVASQLSGEFTLPKSTKEKLVFIAGGIGITPFRSMLQSMLDRGERRDIVLLYSNKTAAEIAYKDVIDRAVRELGVRAIYALTNEPTPVAGAYMGFIDAALIARVTPDFRERTFYISGPRGMVDAFKKSLREAGVPRRRIKEDFFPGFA
jgi:ferredoxin-NADP reductase/Na+-translocating ferredoxin:NAD+ oxidoreductase RnfD subunit